MSCYIVETKHIVYLAKAAIHFGGFRGFSYYSKNRGTRIEYGHNLEHTQKLANVLNAENYKSYNYRYKEEDTSIPEITIDDVMAYNWGGMYKPGEVAKAISCYDYQSCEHPDYEDSDAHAAVQSMRYDLLQQLRGYDTAEWGCPEPTRDSDPICLTDLLKHPKLSL